MKVYITTDTLGEGSFETVEVKQRFEADNLKSAPAHHILQKALRVSNALKKAGLESNVQIVPQSASELQRLLKKGKKVAEMIWHFNEIKASKAKDLAVKKWSNMTIYAK